ncbi:hypothetical protein, partial [Photobacterium phosphoreum]|uniref:hypothetical protein n=1 Tax=Photobacterium phosphoreum TaxID=659 RepID=UPI001E469140
TLHPYQHLLDVSYYLFSLATHGANEKLVQVWSDDQIKNDSDPQRTIHLPNAKWELFIFPKNG